MYFFMQNSRSLKGAFDSSFNVHFSVFAQGQFFRKRAASDILFFYSFTTVTCTQKPLKGLPKRD